MEVALADNILDKFLIMTDLPTTNVDTIATFTIAQGPNTAGPINTFESNNTNLNLNSCSYTNSKLSLMNSIITAVANTEATYMN